MNFDEATLKANRNGQLTSSQTMSLYFNNITWGAVQVTIGLALCTIGIRGDRPALMILGLLFGIGLILRGLQLLNQLYQDTRSGVQQYAGTITISTQKNIKTGERGTASGSTRYYLHTEKLPAFPIDLDWYKALQTQPKTQRYRLYYLPRLKTILSYELFP